VELGESSLDEMSLASPALAPDALFIRTQTRLSTESWFNHSVRPQDDFFTHVNGGWLAKASIPRIRPRLTERGSRPTCRRSARVIARSACIAYIDCMQYTIRGIPPAVDSALRERARASGKSLNEAAVDALAEGSGMTGSRRKRRDLADIAGTWKADKAVEAALADQDRVDEDLWQ
jgi:hypothetical protein